MFCSFFVFYSTFLFGDLDILPFFSLESTLAQAQANGYFISVLLERWDHRVLLLANNNLSIFVVSNLASSRQTKRYFHIYTT